VTLAEFKTTSRRLPLERAFAGGSRAGSQVLLPKSCESSHEFEVKERPIQRRSLNGAISDGTTCGQQIPPWSENWKWFLW